MFFDVKRSNNIQAKLAWESYSTFSNWQEEIGGECGFTKTGFALLVGNNDKYRVNLEKNTQEYIDIGIPINLLNPNEFRNMQPHISLEDVSRIAFEPSSGYGDPNLATVSLINRAKMNGLRVLEGTQITGFVKKRNGISGVTINIGNINAETVILCSGAWMPILAKQLEVSIPIEKKRIGICFFNSEENFSDTPSMTYIDDINGSYFRPLNRKQLLVGVSANNGKKNTNNKLLLAEEDFIQAKNTISKRIPFNNFKPMGGRYGFDAYTPDKHPIVGPIEGIDGIYLASGFSGGGFKISPAIGKAVAQEIINKVENEPLKQLRLERFSSGKDIIPKRPYMHM